MVVTIDINNLVTYEKYRKQLMANAEVKQIVEFAKNPAAFWSSVKMSLERMKR
jgi:hypothetical protein